MLRDVLSVCGKWRPSAVPTINQPAEPITGLSPGQHGLLNPTTQISIFGGGGSEFEKRVTGEMAGQREGAL